MVTGAGRDGGQVPDDPERAGSVSEAEPYLEVLARLVGAGKLLPDEVVDAYRRLLESGRIPVAEAEEQIAPAGVLEQLGKCGLAWRTDDFLPRTWSPVLPEVALGAMLTVSANHVQATAQVWLDAMRLLARSANAAGLGGQVGETTSDDSVWHHLGSRIELVTSGERVEELTGPGIGVMAMARDEFSSFETLITERPPDDALARFPSPIGKERGVRFRALYDRPQLSSPVAQRVIARCISEGEEAAVVDHLPLKMKLADAHTVLLPLGNTGVNGAILIENALIAGAFRELFELRWSGATPLVAESVDRVVEQPPVTDNGKLTSMERKVLGMLAVGATIESIAHRTETPKRTVNRHLQRVREKLGAKTSFQAAVLAVQAGWLPRQGQAAATTSSASW